MSIDFHYVNINIFYFLYFFYLYFGFFYVYIHNIHNLGQFYAIFGRQALTIVEIYILNFVFC